MASSITIPAQASPAEKWILFILQKTGSMKATAKECGRTVRRIQQVIHKYNIDVVNA